MVDETYTTQVAYTWARCVTQKSFNSGMQAKTIFNKIFTLVAILKMISATLMSLQADS